ncbi:hypothetical protein BDZ88DRAFT_404982 [Geranomyces variabilis]|nr:hypothetical protein BDZ88DRAFT_404982 [Geranomyces variabilis]KAJ3143346.1 hypothetical protein HDU90_000106 [Geranomyces variabilis]
MRVLTGLDFFEGMPPSTVPRAILEKSTWDKTGNMIVVTRDSDLTALREAIQVFVKGKRKGVTPKVVHAAKHSAVIANKTAKIRRQQSREAAAEAHEIARLRSGWVRHQIANPKVAAKLSDEFKRTACEMAVELARFVFENPGASAAECTARTRKLEEATDTAIISAVDTVADEEDTAATAALKAYVEAVKTALNDRSVQLDLKTYTALATMCREELAYLKENPYLWAEDALPRLAKAKKMAHPVVGHLSAVMRARQT